MTETSRPVGRPRDAHVDAALLKATQDLLLELGFDRLSVDSVAALAGVSKAAIYRRWSGKTELVVAAVSDLAQVPELVDTGVLHEDLLACARTFVQNERTQRVLAGLMTAMARHDELRTAARQALGAPFADLFQQVIARAAERGQVAASADLALVAEVFPALAFHRSAALGLSVDDEFAVRVVDQLLLPLLDRGQPTT